ncbi:MAG: hypothetical protein AWU57_555 [Marinobacter sp. T13-3]|nr:MAG: hypothetical protein AWU57_555 [Marinobacter sp. T13-3]
MNLTLNDVIAYTPVYLFAFFMAVGILLIAHYLKERWPMSGICAGISLAMGLIMMGIWSSGRTNIEPAFERFQTFYETFANQEGFWIRADLEELATHGTINGQEFKPTAVALNSDSSSNEAAAMINRYFPSDNYNVSEPTILSALKVAVRRCMEGDMRNEYLLQLSEVPVSMATYRRIKNSLNMLYPEPCGNPAR